jgi:hypothetical protein
VSFIFSVYFRLYSIDWYYHIWKWGVIFTDNVCFFQKRSFFRLAIRAVFAFKSFLYIFWYFSFSVIGNFNPFFFACHLLDIAISIKTLTTILKSITHNGKQVCWIATGMWLQFSCSYLFVMFKLLLTILFMSVLIYMYTIIAFNFFRKFYSQEEEGEVEQNCKDLFTVSIPAIFGSNQVNDQVGSFEKTVRS